MQRLPLVFEGAELVANKADLVLTMACLLSPSVALVD